MSTAMRETVQRETHDIRESVIRRQRSDSFPSEDRDTLDAGGIIVWNFKKRSKNKTITCTYSGVLLLPFRTGVFGCFIDAMILWLLQMLLVISLNGRGI